MASSEEAVEVEQAIVAEPKAKKSRSGRYKPGARKGQGDTRISKGAEKVLKGEIKALQEQNDKLKDRIKELERELEWERSRRLAFEGEEAEHIPRYRRAMRDLR